MKTILKLTLFLLLFLIACSKENSTYSYQLNGSSASYDVEYLTPSGDTASVANVPGNWKYSWEQEGTRNQFFRATGDGSSGYMILYLKKDGKIIEQGGQVGNQHTAEIGGNY